MIIVLRKLLACSLLALLFFGCGKANKNGVITGKLSHCSSRWIHLLQITENGDINIDSVITGKDGSFKLKNPADAPDFYLLRTNETNVIFLLLRKGENANVNGNAEDIEKTYTISGSKDSELLKMLREYDRNLSDSLNTIFTTFRQQSPDKADSLGAIFQEVYASRMETFAKTFISTNLSSIVSLSATKFLNQQHELALMQALNDSLTASFPQNRYVVDYNNLMEGLKKLPPGSAAPEINMPTPEGKMISLSSLKGRVVLLDFWASWCQPCRRENPNIVNLYNKFKGKEFIILGISLDNNIAAWKTAIQADKLSWIQVSDLKKWESSVVKEYNIEAIPYNVLIDKEGKIVAKGLRTDDIELRLNSMLK